MRFVLPRHRDIAVAPVEYDATPSDYALVAIRVLPALAIVVTPFVAFGVKTSCTSQLPRVDCSAVDHAVVWHVAAQAACLAAAWFVGRRSGRRLPVWSVAGMCVLAAATALVYAVTGPG